MKLISAIIRPKFVPKLAWALRNANVPGVTFLEAKGFGREQAQVDIEMVGYLSECVQVEVVIEDDQVERVSDLIIKTTSTGHEGDGIICIWDLVGYKRIDQPKSEQPET